MYKIKREGYIMLNVKWNILLIMSVGVVIVFGSNSYCEIFNFNILPLNSQTTTNPAVLNLSGSKYIQDVWVEDIIQNKIQVGLDEKFVASIISANQSGTASDVLNLWNPDERTEIGVYINNPDMFKINQDWYKNVSNSAFLVKVFYGEFTVFVVQHIFLDSTSYVKLYSIKNVNGSYYMTNLLSRDPIYLNYIIKTQDLVPLKTKTKTSQP